ncbi:helix-turn-helix domain-containing protein [Weissella muntiaci]|uniref:helix-turn-helix domain-containing protein n=1 Tax=Weissella muntiaci TaxID=2508881 RepID=UPI001FE5CC2F|nr:helix-turn-helix transcriptional regulator [Weissella muntiaci]
MDISNGTINKWDRVAPSYAYAQSVANYFGVSVDYLLGNADEKKPTQTEPTEKDLEDAFIGAEAYDGKPITDHDKEVIKALIKGYLDTKEG